MGGTTLMKDIYAIVIAFFTAFFGFFGVMIREMRQSKFILEQLKELREDFHDHINNHEKGNRYGRR